MTEICFFASLRRSGIKIVVKRPLLTIYTVTRHLLAGLSSHQSVAGPDHLKSDNCQSYWLFGQFRLFEMNAIHHCYLYFILFVTTIIITYYCLVVFHACYFPQHAHFELSLLD